ncbi:MAG: glycosyltransferase 36 associated family protein [Rhodospirillales bacterium]|nr:glycosyltransferase 36 associated family protein [Rhodospirillales bacterium]
MMVSRRIPNTRYANLNYSLFRVFQARAAEFSQASQDPIRSDLLSVERLEEQAQVLARSQRVTLEPQTGRPLAPRLRDNAKVLTEAYQNIALSAKSDHPITPAAEWMLDNFHIVEEQVREILDDLPPAFYRRLPKLSEGRLAGYPRVFGIAWDIVAHTDSGFDLERLSRYVVAYQRIQPLTIGELWAIAITLRLVLVENLRRLAEAIVSRHTAYQRANAIADRLIGAGEQKPETVEDILRSLTENPWSKPFAVQLNQQLRDQAQSVIPVLNWLDEQLAGQGTGADEIVREEHWIQGAMNVTVRNIITSMRLVSTVDWPEFVEKVSLVDAALRAGSKFADMDFPTRDIYRTAIEELARGSERTELEVTQRVIAAVKSVDLAGLCCEQGDRRRDPGYYLIARGRKAFEAALGFRVPARQWLARVNASFGIFGYLGMIGLATASLLAVALVATVQTGELHGWPIVLLGLLGLVPASDLAMALINQAAIERFGPAILPGLELRDGIPADLRTMVVIPTLLTSAAETGALIRRLEVHYLSSPDGELYFALLSDWTDSTTETRPGDAELLATAEAGIADLNSRYGAGPNGRRFLLLHRRRLWSNAEGKWMGWERKRGKLHELNRLLRGATDTTFVATGDRPVRVPDAVRYVITLDSDTRLPRGTARRLVGKMAHALNRPVIEPTASRVVEGHGILQPRVTPSLPEDRGGSLFQRAFSGSNGLDPYAFAVSDIYQDLFAEGSYVGKGIYDVDAFEAALHGRIPESTVLSHDLLEGIFTRAALASDVELVEEFPARYDVASARQHRWVRGDWQLLPWIFGKGRESGAHPKKAAVPAIGRWKMMDNLRRSLLAPSALLALLAGWTLPLEAGLLWTAFILGTIVLPLTMPALMGIIPQRVGISKRSHFVGIGTDLVRALIQASFLITFLAHQAWVVADALLRTAFRMAVGRRLLEWTTAAQAAYLRPDRRILMRQMAGSVVFGIAAMLALLFYGLDCWLIAAPLILLWAASPLLARWASETPAIAGHMAVSLTERRELRLVARRTWRFFETFITAENHMLPPDNFQEDPQPVVANRTSPTNIGLYLLSLVVARDFGWQGTLSMTDRLDATFASLCRMERFRGHFYNWYDTSDLRPLEPKYISSVDSGNLAGHLIALGNACREMIGAPLIGDWSAGIADALSIAQESVQAVVIEHSGSSPALKRIEKSLGSIAEALDSPPADPTGVAMRLTKLTGLCLEAVEVAKAASMEVPVNAAASEMLSWIEAVQVGVAAHLRELEVLTPWATLLARDPALLTLANAQWLASSGDMLERSLDSTVSLETMPTLCAAMIRTLTSARAEAAIAESSRCHARGRRDVLVTALQASIDAATALTQRLSALSKSADMMYAGMDFAFLFDPGRQLLSIGYQVQDERLDGSYYDLLASEARLASFVAIAKGDIPAKHWFRMGRTLTAVAQGSVLISWSGSMFEYLMPSLVMRAPPGSLLEQTNRLSVRRQISYGAELGVPWGVSESQYNARDLEFTYQYAGFGIPDLGYKRGLTENIVIAPYATGLAAMVDPDAAARNFRDLTQEGGRGAYGWYEALDYTPDRLPEGAKVAIVRAYMAHHQAMCLIGIADAIEDGRMRARFHAEPIIQATELLLQERMPRGVPVARPMNRHPSGQVILQHVYPEMQRRFNSPHSRVPRTHLLSNGRYSVMVTGAGSGYSRWRDIDVTRWREDATSDSWGSYIYLRDMRTNDIWSTGYQPSAVEPESYEVVFSEDRAEIIREDGAITTTQVVAISPEDDAEVRRVTITNHGARMREVELTSYAEIVLARQADDRAHQAFSKLFVETEFLPEFGAILAKRRPRAEGDPEIWAAHLTVVEGDTIGDVQFETDRVRFLGRGHGTRSPVAVLDGWPLSNTAGAVLDPIFSLRRRVRLARGATANISFWTLVASTRAELLVLIDKHHDPMAYERATTFAWTQAQVQLHHLGIGPGEAHLYQRIANRIVYSDATLRPASDILRAGMRNASTLWANGISGDLPIVLVRIEESEDLAVVRQLLRAYEYWRMKQLAVDLVILNEKPTSYVQDLQVSLETMVRTSRSGQPDQFVRGNVYVLRGDLVSPEVLGLLQSAARVVISARRGTLAEQIRRIPDAKIKTPATPTRRPSAPTLSEPPQPRPELEFSNGFGGFAENGREYVTMLERDQWTPAPWINVIANRNFGFHVSTEGSGFTWSVNSQQNQITSWSNDPVRDPPGEAIYIRDEDSGEFWTPTALPIREQSAYVIHHGPGYTRFEHASHAIALELLQFVPVDDPIKISRLKVSNRSARERNLSVTAYAEWVLGTSRGVSAPFIVTELAEETGAILASNPWHNDFGTRVAFFDLGGRQTAWTGDRAEFLGRNGTLARPAALIGKDALSGSVGAGFDPCAVLQGNIRLQPGETTEILVFIGQTAARDEAQALIRKYRAVDLDKVMEAVASLWGGMLDTVQVKTPDRAMDVMLNGWLPYQTLACRVWARAGFYQASGAYGFRDQLQDVMALCLSRPDIAREHILRAAARQFPEGDVQHWWLPESGRGIRTRISDDAIWLSHVTCHYMEVTGDTGILDEPVAFLEGPPLTDSQHDNFFEPAVSQTTATLFEHCARGLDRSLATGTHGLPLIGTGDWNDGMNAVGAGGKGESVWLGWFLYCALTDFAHTATARNETKRAAAWLLHVAKLKESLEESWDGDWYRRAYFDDGTPMGSIQNSECRIDSIAQSWSVISKGAEPARAQRAMAAVEKYLVKRDDGLVLLFAPPFDTSKPNPGYIQGYPKGVRENGGQYTHGSSWTVLAFAMLGDGDRAHQLYSLMNPINHGGNNAGIHRYRVEPYVVCGDLYSTPPNAGRGGWTWYSGSAGWMYRVALEGILGFHQQGDHLKIDPCIPRSWPGFEIVFRYRSSRYDIAVENPRGVCKGVVSVELDGNALLGSIPLADDGATHKVRIVLGS